MFRIYLAALVAQVILDPGKLYLIGIAASIVAQIIKIVAVKFGKKPTKVGITLIAFGLSIGMAAIWYSPVLPPITDPMEFALALFAAATSVLGAAVGIYNVILEKLFQKLGDLFGVLLEP